MHLYFSQQTCTFFFKELGLDDVGEESEKKFEVVDYCEWDPLDDYEQVEILKEAASWSCEMGLGKVR